MEIKLALAGNPNCGKTTMFNALTGSAQYVGNWPGVTVEKKEGKVRGAENILVTDLPGIYSLSPYTNEEIVSRDYLASEEPCAVINIVDATNIERNLYLTTQILELGKPVVLALNMVDAMEKAGDKIDVARFSERLGCKVVKTVALRNKGTKEVLEAALEASKKKSQEAAPCFSSEVEKAISEAAALLPDTVPAHLKRWSAIKLLERDSNLIERLEMDSYSLARAESISQKLEQSKDDDIESIITNERYEYITKILDGVLVKSKSKMTASDKIDRIVTNRILGIPIFLFVMWFVYYVAVATVGTMASDWANDSLVGGIQSWLEENMSKAGASEVLVDCVVNGIVGGVGAVLGFVPQMAILFFLLSVLEDVGYMVRIAFVMDRLFRKFGLSGKSFIPLLISSGCGVPGIMSSRTIENENDRRMTIMTTTWIPCGAKLPVIALMSIVIGSVAFGEPARAAFIGPLMYVVGIASVMLASVMLKKTKAFHGPAAPFVMELPQYHIPQMKTVLLHTWERVKGFVVKAGTVLFIACLVIWFLSNYGIASPKEAEYADDGALIQEASAGGFGLVDADESILSYIGGGLSYAFRPLGFGTYYYEGETRNNWQAAAAVISGFSAKEAIVSTMGVLAGVDEDESEDEEVVSGAIAEWFPTALAAFAFLMFNLLDSPCLAAIATMANELKDRKWFWFAIVFQNVFAYIMTMIVYQVGTFFCGGTFGVATAIAFALLAFVLVMLLRPNPYAKEDAMKSKATV